ncbi:hypothetical protein PsorP6_012228 [Peronosclerospora sorghi]|uniref:Uncharacterized protein n=1 Tax=Peronosclerospora sorghi TaxID=230839 RepID=A0ACC0WKY4_9STRA|nr:hypothetical protein PsorP6_012228 [Peronosclerospora sorghi]
MRRNSSSLISPSPSRSASSIISCSSSSVIFSPSSVATRFKFRNEILPVPSSSKSRKALRISSRESFSLILNYRCRPCQYRQSFFEPPPSSVQNPTHASQLLAPWHRLCHYRPCQKGQKLLGFPAFVPLSVQLSCCSALQL